MQDLGSVSRNDLQHNTAELYFRGWKGWELGPPLWELQTSGTPIFAAIQGPGGVTATVGFRIAYATWGTLLPNTSTKPVAGLLTSAWQENSRIYSHMAPLHFLRLSDYIQARLLVESYTHLDPWRCEGVCHVSFLDFEIQEDTSGVGLNGC